MGPRARRRELQRAPRCVVRGGSRLPRRRRARREPADRKHRPHLRPDRADPAAALVGRGTPARRRQSSIELGLALRRLPELPSSLTAARTRDRAALRSEEHTSELQSPCNLVCRLLLEKKKKKNNTSHLTQITIRNQNPHTR